MVLIGVAFLSHLVQDTLIIAPEEAPSLLTNYWLYLLTFYIPMALAVAIGIGVAWRYWSWIWKEHQE